MLLPKSLLLIISTIIISINFALGQTSPEKMIGMARADYFTKNVGVLQNPFDSLIHIQHEKLSEQRKLMNIISFRDTIIAVQLWEGVELIFNDDGTVSFLAYYDTLYYDTESLQACRDYFLATYSLPMDLTSLPTTYTELRQQFGLLGPDPIPTGEWKTYEALKGKGITNEDLSKLLVSLNPIDQLIGAMLYDPSIHQVPKKLVELARNSEFKVNFRFGCMPGLGYSIKEYFEGKY